MKKLLAALALTSVACAAPAMASDVGVSIRIGDPGFYGQLDFDSGYYSSPRLIYSQPVLIERRYRNLAPVYLRVPPGHARNWGRYCDRYNACARPVYFVRDDWYRDVYVPRYRERHVQNWRDERHDRRDEWRDERHDRRDHWRDDRWDNRHDDRRDDRHDRDRDHDHDHDHDRRDHDRNYRD